MRWDTLNLQESVHPSREDRETYAVERVEVLVAGDLENGCGALPAIGSVTSTLFPKLESYRETLVRPD